MSFVMIDTRIEYLKGSGSFLENVHARMEGTGFWSLLLRHGTNLRPPTLFNKSNSTQFSVLLRFSKQALCDMKTGNTTWLARDFGITCRSLSPTRCADATFASHSVSIERLDSRSEEPRGPISFSRARTSKSMATFSSLLKSSPTICHRK